MAKSKKYPVQLITLVTEEMDTQLRQSLILLNVERDKEGEPEYSLQDLHRKAFIDLIRKINSSPKSKKHKK